MPITPKDSTLTYHFFTKSARFVVIGMLMKCLNYWSQVRFQTDFDKENSDGEIFFDLLGGDGVYWYMFAMAAFMGLCYLLRNSRPWAVLTASMVTALAINNSPVPEVHLQSPGAALCYQWNLHIKPNTKHRQTKQCRDTHNKQPAQKSAIHVRCFRIC